MRTDLESHLTKDLQDSASSNAGLPSGHRRSENANLDLQAGRRLRVLLIAFGFPIQYRALRTSVDAGADVFVLGSKESKPLKLSRYCRNFRLMDEGLVVGSHEDTSAKLRQIQQCCAEWKIDLILASDKWSVQLLGRLKPALNTAVFPVPEPDQFELLDNKWRFYQLCKQLSIPVPQSWYFESKDALLQAIGEGKLPDALIAKPLQLYGEIGIQKFSARSAQSDLNCAIVGFDGNCLARLSYVERLQEKQFGCETAILNHAERIVKEMGLSGIYNFDTRRTDQGKFVFFECNPRPYMTMQMTAQAGINCITVMLRALAGKADPVANMPECTIGRWRGLLRAAVIPWKAGPRNRTAILDCLKDPLPLLPQVAEFVKGKISGKVAWVR